MKKLNILFAVLFSSLCLSFAHAAAVTGNKTTIYMGGQCKILSETDVRTRSGLLSWDTFTNYGSSSVEVSCPFAHESGRKNIRSGWVKINDWNPDANVACWVSHKSVGQPSTITAVNLTIDSVDQNSQILRFDTLQQSSSNKAWSLICSVPPNSAILAYHLL